EAREGQARPRGRREGVGQADRDVVGLVLTAAAILEQRSIIRGSGDRGELLPQRSLPARAAAEYPFGGNRLPGFANVVSRGVEGVPPARRLRIDLEALLEKRAAVDAEGRGRPAGNGVVRNEGQAGLGVYQRPVRSDRDIVEIPRNRGRRRL